MLTSNKADTVTVITLPCCHASQMHGYCCAVHFSSQHTHTVCELKQTRQPQAYTDTHRLIMLMDAECI